MISRKMSGSRKEVAELFSSVCSSRAYEMKFSFMGHMEDDVRRFGKISGLQAFAYKSSNMHFQKAY